MRFIVRTRRHSQRALCASVAPALRAPFGLGRQLSRCGVRLLVLGTTKAFVAFLASLG